MLLQLVTYFFYLFFRLVICTKVLTLTAFASCRDRIQWSRYRLSFQKASHIWDLCIHLIMSVCLLVLQYNLYMKVKFHQ